MTDFPDLQPWPPFPLGEGMRWWRLDFTCDGAPFTWSGEASSEAAAESRARARLSQREPTFVASRARLAVCIEGA